MIDKAMSEVVDHGKHLSAVIAALLAELKPDRDTATAIRAELYGRVRALGMPAFLRDRLHRDHGASVAEAIITSLMDDAPVFIRPNTLRASTADVQRALPGSIRRTDNGVDALQVPDPYGLFRTTAYLQGWFEQQDLVSQRVSVSVAPQPGMRVVDACAGAGGKALHMAALMQNRGRIIALDVNADKLNAMMHRANRGGVTIIDPRPIRSTKIIKRLADSADRVLLDVPCSGTGVIRRNPDIMLHLTERSIDELVHTQAELLQRHARTVKPGGLLCYANCSLLHEEGKRHIERFLVDMGTSFTCIDEWQTLPHETDGDGFYMAVLRRTHDTK